ncbi:6-hydroxymethylpterin diphosphokinase MptE-like protein [Pseudaeromonas sp. ZJS20]|uniref:motility associated factor glycosyltransferase family protein n=1 Tax=Pseudaeromonas aegiceratis TaxID=3153928 RepID=UPI00390CA70E
MDINKLILETEQQADKLRLQSEQEKAMAEVLPLRFAQNMAAFERLMPAIYEQFRAYQPTRAFRLYCNANGEPNLLWLDDNVSLYGDEPLAQSKAQIEQVMGRASLSRLEFGVEKNFFGQIHVKYLNMLAEEYQTAKKTLNKLTSLPETVPMALVFGVGLGYHLGYLYERCSVKNLFVIEPDLDLFYASLFCFDWAPLLDYLDSEKMSLHILLGQDEESMMNDLMPAIHKRGAFLVASMFAYWHYPSPTIFSLIERVSQEFYTLRTGWGFFDDNLFAISHSAENIIKGAPFLLKGKKVQNEQSQCPVFVVGNGPSLDAALPYIKEYQQNALIICCGSSVYALHKEGIKPDIYVAVERTKSSADFLATLNDPDYLQDILFLSVDVIHPDCLAYFDRSAMGFKPNEPMYAMLKANQNKLMEQYTGLLNVNPLVGNTGLSYAVTLGFKNIYLFGMDNGYKSKEHHHAKNSSYYDKDGKPIEALKKLMTGRAEFMVPGNFGGEVVTNQLLGLSARHMGTLLRLYSDVICHNCSDGAQVKNAIPLPLDEFRLDEVALDKDRLVDEIYEKLFVPISVSADKLQDYLAIELFNKLVDKIIEVWQPDCLTYEDVNERTLVSFELVTSLAVSPYHHVYRVLVGSMNYYLSVITSILYAFSDKEETFHLLRKCIAIFIEFLQETKVLYAKALAMKDKTDFEPLKHMRKN